jgi:hypothetical protein
MNPDAIKRTIVDGVAAKQLAYVGRVADGHYEPFHFGTALAESDIEISDEMYLLMAEEAKLHVEPPRIERLLITPASATVGTGEEVAFSASGFDQHGRPIGLEAIEWSATSGAIDRQGRLVAAAETGVCVVTATAGGVVAAARVDVQVQDGRRVGRDRDNEGQQRPQPRAVGLHWRGDVPPRKWMNLYTKVLSRLASQPGLKLTVEVDVPPSAALTESTVEATRVALRELGLDESLQ